MTEDSMHRTLDAALARNSGPSAEDVEALAGEERHDLTNASCRAHRPGTETFICHPCADAEIKVLERILAAHTAAAKREGARAVVEAVEAAWSAIPNPQHPGTGAALRLAARAAAEQTGGA